MTADLYMSHIGYKAQFTLRMNYGIKHAVLLLRVSWMSFKVTFPVKVNSKHRQHKWQTALERRAFFSWGVMVKKWNMTWSSIFSEFHSQFLVILAVQKPRKIWEALEEMTVLWEIRSTAMEWATKFKNTGLFYFMLLDSDYCCVNGVGNLVNNTCV